MMDVGPADAEPVRPPHGIAAAAVACGIFSSFLFGYCICVLDSCSELLAISLGWCGNDWEASCPESESRQALINSAAFFCVGAATCLYAQSFHALAAGRAICGI